jgi:hypothetical protein
MNLIKGIIVQFLLSLFAWSNLNGQTLSFGFTGASGVMKAPQAVSDYGELKPRTLPQYMAQGGPYLNFELAMGFFIRASAQHTGINYGVRVDFDPSVQPETPVQTYSKNRFWFTAPQLEVRLGYKVKLDAEKSIFIIAGYGRRTIYSTRHTFTSVVGLSTGQGLVLYKERLYMPDSRVPVYSIGAEYAIPVWRNYDILIGLEYQYCDFVFNPIYYEFFPARTASYSSGTYKVSPHQIALRVSVPLLIWKKKKKEQ